MLGAELGAATIGGAATRTMLRNRSVRSGCAANNASIAHTLSSTGTCLDRCNADWNLHARAHARR